MIKTENNTGTLSRVVQTSIKLPRPLYNKLIKLAAKERRSLHNLMIVKLEQAK